MATTGRSVTCLIRGSSRTSLIPRTTSGREDSASAGEDTRHAARRGRPQGAAGELRAIPQVPAARPGYYAVKANSAPEIVRTFYEAGASFDVASLAEFLMVHENVKDCRTSSAGVHLDRHHLRQPHQGERDAGASSIVQAAGHVRQLREVIKIARHAPHAGLVLRVRVPNTGSMVELSSKFGASSGEALDSSPSPTQPARGRRPELPRRQPVHQYSELPSSLELAAGIFSEARSRASI